MQSGFTAHITRAEWSWVILVAVALVLVAFAPYALLAVAGINGDEWQFMGILHNSRDGATYLSKMMLGMQGQWLVNFQHTPEPHSGAFLQVIYPMLGQLARLIGTPVLVVFHAVRAVAAIFMYMALYQLAATIWMRVRTRRIFFSIVAIGAGLGWLYAILSGGNINSPDLSIPEAFPLHSTFVNVHFPLTIGCLALLTSIIIDAFRPGTQHEPNMSNGGFVAVVLSVALSLLYPQALVPIGAAIVAYVALLWFTSRKLPVREIRWLLVIALPALPLAVYYGAVVMYNPAMAEWSRQNVTSAPSPWLVFIGFSLPLLVAVPAIARAIRRFFAAHDDRFMLIWLVMMVVAMYLPTPIQRRFIVGMMIPLAYFGTRALESFWFERVTSRRWRYRLFVLLLPVMVLSQVFVLLVPLLPVLVNRPQEAQGLFLEHDYVAVFNWLAEETESTDVVLASENTSLWLPGWAGTRVVYGHPFETLDAQTKQQQVEAWYSGQCDEILDRYDIKYVLSGPQESDSGETACLDGLREVIHSGDVTVYAR